MTSAALVDIGRLRLAPAGTRIPRRAWAELQAAQQLLAEADAVLRQAQQQAETLRSAAQAQGLAEGRVQAQVLAARQLLQAQAQAREFVDASEQRIAALAVAIVARIAPGLDQAELVTALARQALAAAQAERHLTVRVHPDAVEAAATALAEWRQAHPALEAAQVAGDAALERGDCVVESELGEVRAGFAAQLESVRQALSAAATPAVGAPAAGAG